MNGPLTQGAWPTLLRDLYLRRHTGVLRLRQGPYVRQLRLSEGQVVGARSSVVRESLGDWLVAAGRLSQVDLDQAATIAHKDQGRLGLALVDLGIVERAQLDEAVERHLRELVQKALESPDGEWEFEEQPASAGECEDLTRNVATAELILQAVRRLDDGDVVRFALGERDRILAVSSDPLLRFQKIQLSPSDGYVLSRVDGTLSAREITQMIPLPCEDVERSLLSLLCTGVIEYLDRPPKKPAARPAAAAAARPAAPAPAPAAPRPEPPPAPKIAPEVEARRKEISEAAAALKGANHFDVLGIPRASNEAQVKEAYFKLARRFHPDSIRKDPALADLVVLAESVFIRVGEASEVLRDARRRSSYEADLAARTPRLAPAPAPPDKPAPAAPPNAEAEARAVEQAIRLGERLVAEEKYWDAIQMLEEALPKAKGQSAGRVRYLLSKALLKNPHWVRRAEELLLVLAKDDPKHVGAHLLLGGIYRQGGLRARAASMYRRVLELHPDHEEARDALQDLTSADGPGPEPQSEPEPPQPQAGGLLKRLFGKGGS